MANLNGLVMWMVAMWLVAGIRYGVDGKINARVGIIAMVSAPHTEKMLEAQKKHVTYFDVGKGKAKLGIIRDVDPMPYLGGIVLELTSDEQAYLNELNKKWEVDGMGNRNHAFAFADSWYFGHGLIARVVVQMMGSCAVTDSVLETWELQAKFLQGRGTWLYIVTEDIQRYVQHARNYHVPSERLFILQSGSTEFVNMMDNVRDAILKDLCNQWDKGCRYTDGTRQQCQFEEWLTFMNNQSQCSTTPPGESGTYPDTSACDHECDQRWPWLEKPDCTDKCGIGFKRNESIPPVGMEHCLHEYLCPECTTTTTTTPETTTATTTTLETKTTMVPTITMTETSTNTSKVVTTASPTVPGNETTRQQKESETTGTPTTMTTMMEVSTEVTMEITPPANPALGSEPQEGSKDWTWLYILLAIVGLLGLIGIIFGIAITQKKRAIARREAARAKASAAAAKAAAMKKPPIPSTASLGNQATVGTTAAKGADASIAADISIAPSISKTRRGGKPFNPSGKGPTSMIGATKSVGPMKK